MYETIDTNTNLSLDERQNRPNSYQLDWWLNSMEEKFDFHSTTPQIQTRFYNTNWLQAQRSKDKKINFIFTRFFRVHPL